MSNDLIKLAAASAETLRAQGLSGREPSLIRAFMLESRGKSSANDDFFAAISTNSDLAPLASGHLQSDMFGRMILPEGLAAAIVASILRGADPSEVLQSATELAAAKTSSISCYVALSGFKVNGEIKIDENTSLVAPEAVPDNPPKDSFMGPKLGIGAPGIFQLRATAFLKVTKGPQRIIFRDNKEQPLKGTPTTDAEAKATEIVRCALVLTGRPTTVLGTWAAFDNPLAAILGPGGAYQYSDGLFDYGLPAVMQKPDALNGDKFLPFYSKWLSLKASDRSALSVAMGRLSQGLRRRDPVDRALDLGIALEVILLHGIERQTELSFRLRVHAANFLGGTNEERVASYKFWGDVYTLRSKAAHNGVLPNNGAAERKLLAKAGELCQVIARKIVERGAIPEWEKEYVLQGGAPGETPAGGSSRAQ